MKLATEKKLQRHMIRFLMIDSQQTEFNSICQALKDQGYVAQGKLLDDLGSFEKALNLQWDAIIFNNAYDFDYKKTLDIIESKGKNIPLILLSDLDAHSPEILEAYQLGTYVVSAATQYHFLTLNLYRASVYTKLVRREHQLNIELDQLQQHTQTLVDNTEHAVAIFQDGVHVSVNEQYAKLFGTDQVDDLLGLPILDVLQPEDITQFKAAYKRLSKDDFSQATFKIQSNNPKSQQKALTLQFGATEFEGDPGLQLVIPTDNHTSQPSAASPQNGFASLEELEVEITASLLDKPVVGMFIFRIHTLPPTLLYNAWDLLPRYFSQLKSNLSQSFSTTIFRLTENIFVLLKPYADESEVSVDFKNKLQKLPASVDLDQQIFSVTAKSAHVVLKQAPSPEQLKSLINQMTAVQAPVTTKEDIIAAPDFQLSIDDAPTPPTLESSPTSTIPELQQTQDDLSESSFSLGEVIIDKDEIPQTPFTAKINTNDASHQSLLEQIENNTIELNFQQLYDKEDIDTHLYEVTASFTHEGDRIQIENYASLNTNADLAIKLDRWILVESSKRLHQFINTCPKAKIVVNLHSVCFTDPSLLMLLNKLVSLINSKYSRPLMLQFTEESVLRDMDNATKFFQQVIEYGIGITISEFGKSNYDTNVLVQSKAVYAKLTEEFTDLLQSDDGMVELQEKLDAYQESVADARFVLPHLDDMTSFANAWNVNARYLQGNYFQSKQTDFVDNAG